MILESEMRLFLLSLDAITALVVDRIFGLVRSQASALPALLIQRTQSTRQVKFCGTDKLVSADIQIDSYGITGDSTWGLAKAVRSALIDFTGTMGEAYVDQVTLTNEFPLTDPEPGIIRVTQIYQFWYVED
jgi:hypothetical protein